MSGIAGMYWRDGRTVDRDVLDGMAEGIAFRGPDGRGAWCQGPVGFCHLMLWTTPESLNESLPLVNPTAGLALTSDARIDNRDDLIDKLAIHDGGQQITDSQLILAAYQKWGEGCPENLVGDFAFALWDSRQQTLFCARDHFGVRPFYYYCSDRLFAFASEIKALLCLEAVPHRLNEVRVADYLGRTELDPTSTFYQEIVQLPDAHCFEVARETVSKRRFWKLDTTRELPSASDEEYDEAFRECFSRAVISRVRSPYPVGSLLSGGLDSSSIVGVARGFLAARGAPKLHTFSGVFDHLTQCDERSFINAVIAKGDVVPHFVTSDRLDPWADIEEVLDEQQEPFVNPFMFVRRAFCDMAREAKIRVLLDGSIGDVIVPHGLGYLTELMRKGRWWSFATQILVLKKTIFQNYEMSLGSLLWHRGMRPLAPDLLVRAWRRLHGRSATDRGPRWAPILNPDLANRIHQGERLADLQADRRRPARTAREEQLRFLSSARYHSFGVMGRAAAAFGVSASHPFADPRLAEFCMALPPEQKLNQGWTRFVFRRAMVDVLPDTVRWRRDKSNLQPLVMSMLFGRSNRQMVENTIFKDAEMIGDYVDLGVLRRTYSKGASWEAPGGYASPAEVQDALHVWRAIIFSLWLRRSGVDP